MRASVCMFYQEGGGREGGKRERERERETDRQTDRQRQRLSERERERESTPYDTTTHHVTSCKATYVRCIRV